MNLKKIHGHILVEKEFHSIFPLFPILYHSKWRQDLKLALIFSIKIQRMILKP